MSSTAVLAAVPRLASTILLLARTPRPLRGHNNIHVLMLKRHSKARFMPGVYVFPGGGVDTADVEAAAVYLSQHYGVRPRYDTANGAETSTSPTEAASASTHVEAHIHPTRVDAETEAWACRMGALRELTEEASCVLRRDGTICTWLQWKERRETQQGRRTSHASAASPPLSSPSTPLQALLSTYDVGAAPMLRPVGRWVTPRHFKYRYDTYFYASLVSGASSTASASHALAASTTEKTALLPAQDLPLKAQASEVAELAWLSPLQALRRHESAQDTFSVAPPTYLLLHALARQISFEALAEKWTSHAHEERTMPSVSAASGRLGTLSYSSVLPSVEPCSRLSSTGGPIVDFVLPSRYLHEDGWSEPDGAYRFCDRALEGERHTLRMWVGAEWAKRVRERAVDLDTVPLRDLTH